METITAKDLTKLQSRLCLKQRKIRENIDYTMGKNPYIIKKPAGKKPDNRMPVTFGKMAVDAMAGYAGKSGNIKVNYDLVLTDTPDENDPFIEYMRKMDDYNESDIEISELYAEGLQQGIAYEIWWTTDKLELPNGLLTTEYKIVSNSEMILKYSYDLKPVLLYAVHFTKDEGNETATIYFPLKKEEWTKIDGGDGWQFSEVLEYPFKTVPVNVYKINRFGISLFEAEKAFIDGVDEIISKSMNEVDRFNAAIALFGDILGKQFAEDFKSGNISMVEGLSSSGENPFVPKYLEKDLSGIKDFYNQLMDRMETWFRKSVGIADFSDDAFAGQQSGIAILFKLIPMEFRASQIETYFNQGLNKRLEYYGDIYNASLETEINIEEYTTIIDSKRNIPVDEKSKIEIVEKLVGIVSQKTLLKSIPNTIVPDVEKEIQLLADDFEDEPFKTDDNMEGEETTTELGTQTEEAAKLSGIQINAANDIIKLVGLPLDAGGITREAGINQLMIFLGLTEAQANLVMGNKQTGKATSKIEVA